jgi:hypothetical protein
MDETDDNPKRAKAIFEPHIPRVYDCAEQLGRALRGVIDPPMPMLEVRGGFGVGSGLVFIRSIPSRSTIPHLSDGLQI